MLALRCLAVFKWVAFEWMRNIWMTCPLWLLWTQRWKWGRGVLNQMHHVVMNSVFENIFKLILWSQWETGLYPLHLKAHAGKGWRKLFSVGVFGKGIGQGESGDENRTTVGFARHDSSECWVITGLYFFLGYRIVLKELFWESRIPINQRAILRIRRQ